MPTDADFIPWEMLAAEREAAFEAGIAAPQDGAPITEHDLPF